MYTQSLPLCVSLVDASMTLMIPLTLSSTVMAAFSKPNASAPRWPRSVCTQLCDVKSATERPWYEVQSQTYPGSTGNAVSQGSSVWIALVNQCCTSLVGA